MIRTKALVFSICAILAAAAVFVASAFLPASVLAQGIVVEYAEWILTDNVQSSVELESVAAGAAPRIVVEYAESIFSATMEQPSLVTPLPAITSVTPNQGTRGQSLSVVVKGTDLTGASQVSFGSGISVSGFTVDGATQMTANITIDATATLGARDVSVTTPGGIGTASGGFTVVANQLPSAPTGLSQFKSDGSTAIATGGANTESSVVFKATIADPDSDQVKLQVELRRLDEYGGQFDETKGGLKEGTLVGSGSAAVANASELIEAGYHWRARTVDEHGASSQWVEFGNNGTSQADFTVSTVPVMKKTVQIFTRPYVATGEMTVTYLPAGQMNGKDTYNVSQVDVKCIGFSGVCIPYIKDSATGVAWSDVLVVGPGAPHLKTYVAGSTVNFPSSIVVTASGTFSITMRGVDVINSLITPEKAAANTILTKLPYLGPILDLLNIDMATILEKVNADPWNYPWYFSKASSAQFSPESAEVATSQVDAPSVNVAYLCSPGELRVYDSTGRATGLVDGVVKDDIPNSAYYDEAVILQGASSVHSYRYEVSGKEEGSYGLIVAHITDEGTTTFSSANLPISLGTAHTYTIDGDALAEGKKGVTLEIDANGDGKPENTVTADTELNRDEFDSATTEPGLPFWIWIIVGVGAVAVIAVGVLIWRRMARKPLATS